MHSIWKNEECIQLPTRSFDILWWGPEYWLSIYKAKTWIIESYLIPSSYSIIDSITFITFWALRIFLIDIFAIHFSMIVFYSIGMLPIRKIGSAFNRYIVALYSHVGSVQSFFDFFMNARFTNIANTGLWCIRLMSENKKAFHIIHYPQYIYSNIYHE